MFPNIDVTVSTLTAIVIGVACIWVYRFVSRKRNLPPGPGIWLPILGNLLEVTRDFRVFMTDFRRRYGDVYSLYMGKDLTVVIAGHDAIKEAFYKRGDVFSDRRMTNLIEKFSDGGKGMAFAPGDRWKVHRDFTVATLKEFGVGTSSLERKILDQAELLVENIDSERGKGFDPRIRLQIGVCNIISSIAFGGQFSYYDNKACVLIGCVQYFMENVGVSGIVQFIPALRFVPGDPFRFHEVCKKIDVLKEFIVNIIEEHLNKYDANNIGDYIDAFIKEMKRKEGQAELNSIFKVDQLAHMIIELFIGGTDTTSSTLTWAILYLVNYPDVQVRMFREIEDHVGTDSFPTLHDKTKLPFTEAVYMEVLRHAGLVCVTVPRTVPHDVMFRGFHLPKGVMILADIHSVLKDASIWDDPETFNPDRFIGDDGAFHMTEEFIPFFTGPRRCPGESLAKMELFLILTALVQRFEFRPPPDEDLSLATLDGVFGFVHAPRPFNVVAIRRGTEKETHTITE